jgi:secreted PhoX family phosphatase
VPPTATTTVPAVPLKALGRFAHEATCGDFDTWVVYETEDNGNNSGFYRFKADQPGNLSKGRLQILAIEGQPNYRT